jgi:drug/metabolite transporter (DMT)-like permease
MARITAAIERWPAALQCAFWVILSGLLITFQLAIVRHILNAANPVSVFEIVFLRGAFGLLVISPLMLRGGGRHLRPNRLGLNLLCGSLAFTATVLFFFAARHLPIADITAIHFSRPIFATIAAALVLHEAMRGSRVLALGLGIVGAAIIIRPGLVEFNIGIAYVIGVIAVQTWNPINRKLLSRHEHPDTVALWNVLVMAFLGLIASLFVWTAPSPEQLAWIGLLGLLETLNQRVLARAYVHGDAMFVVGLHYTRLPIAALVGYVAFGEAPDMWVWIGAAVIAMAAVTLARGEMTQRQAQ